MMPTMLISEVNRKLKSWRELSRQRRELGALSDHLLKDIGLSRVDAEREAGRPFWDNRLDFDRTLRSRSSGRKTLSAEKCKVKCCPQA